MPNLNIREADGSIIQTLAEGDGTSNDPKVPGSTAHAHKSSGYAHMHIPTIAAPATIDVLLLDLDDTTNFPHTDTYRWHLDVLDAAIDPGTNSAWVMSLWLVEDVTATDCTRIMFWERTGAKIVGNRLDIFERWTPYGPVGDSNKIVSSIVETGYTNWNSVTNLRTIYSTGTPVATPGNGDMILSIDVSGDDVALEINFGYHTHDPGHPG
jgi:hypothetical protein